MERSRTARRHFFGVRRPDAALVSPQPARRGGPWPGSSWCGIPSPSCHHSPVLRYIRRVNPREFLLENFAGDLEYHPRRAALYLIIGAAAASFWVFSPAGTKFTAIPLVFALGSLTLFTKGIFLLRKSSEGLGLSDSDLAGLSSSSNRKGLPQIPTQAAQLVQDFGAGSLLLWPLLNVGKDIDQSWINPPRLQVAVTGLVLFFLGWVIRRFTSP
jgi:hypothetical protein